MANSSLAVSIDEIRDALITFLQPRQEVGRLAGRQREKRALASVPNRLAPRQSLVSQQFVPGRPVCDLLDWFDGDLLSLRGRMKSLGDPSEGHDPFRWIRLIADDEITLIQ